MGKTIWPVASEVREKLLRFGITTTVTDGNLNYEVSAAVAELFRLTKRQFLADTTASIRYFDGSNNGKQQIDDFVELTEVVFIGFIPLYPYVLALDVLYFEKLAHANNVLHIRQGSIPAFSYISRFNIFPAGRGNIKVTAKWGFDEFIPDDVWLYILDQATAKVADELQMTTAGQLRKWTDGAGVSEEYGGKTISQSLQLKSRRFSIVSQYALPLAVRLNESRPRMT